MAGCLSRVLDLSGVPDGQKPGGFVSLQTLSEFVVTQYDPVGNVTKITLPGGNTVSSEYDGLNRKIKEIYSDGGYRYFAYDGNDNIRYQDEPNGYRSYFQYNELNQLVKTTDALGGVTESLYNEAGNPTWIKDENANIRRMVYDEAGRILKETDGRNGVSTFAYDLSGNLAERKDPKGTTVTTTYGATNLATLAVYTGTSGSQSFSYSYDEAGIRKRQINTVLFSPPAIAIIRTGGSHEKISAGST